MATWATTTVKLSVLTATLQALEDGSKTIVAVVPASTGKVTIVSKA